MSNLKPTTVTVTYTVQHCPFIKDKMHFIEWSTYGPFQITILLFLFVPS